jgi:hypothetical protein
MAAPLHATAAVTAGSPCKKIASTTIAGGKKFTCIKAGKKLVWDKGVLQKASTKPSPTPTTPATATQKLDFPISPEIQKLDQLVQQAFSAAKPAEANIDIQVGPGKESAQIAEIAKESLNSALLMASILKIKLVTPLTVYIGNRDWLTPKMPAGTWCADPMMGVPGPAGGGFCGLSTRVIFLSVDGLMENDGKKISRDFTKTPDRLFISFGFVHELLHAMQGEASMQYAQYKGNYNPYWLNEGGANFGAMMSQAYLYKIPFSQIRVYIATYSSCVLSQKSTLIKDFIKNTGQPNVCGPYYDGYLWTEYLVASTGDFGAMVDLAKQNEKVGSELTYDPSKPDEFEEKKLALSMKYGYAIDFNTFITNAQAYSDAATLQLRKWLSANNSIYPQTL